MKTVRNFMTLVAVSFVLFALCAAGAKARVISSAHFSGTFTLPFEVQWGTMTLPAGEYNLYYGSVTSSGALYVEVVGQAEGSPHGVLQTKGYDLISTTKSSLVCIRQGNSRIVRELQMGLIGEAVYFLPPRGTKFEANQRNHNVYAQLGEVPVLIERVPVKISGK